MPPVLVGKDSGSLPHLALVLRALTPVDCVQAVSSRHEPRLRGVTLWGWLPSAPCSSILGFLSWTRTLLPAARPSVCPRAAVFCSFQDHCRPGGCLSFPAVHDSDCVHVGSAVPQPPGRPVAGITGSPGVLPQGPSHLCVGVSVSLPPPPSVAHSSPGHSPWLAEATLSVHVHSSSGRCCMCPRTLPKWPSL